MQRIGLHSLRLRGRCRCVIVRYHVSPLPVSRLVVLALVLLPALSLAAPCTVPETGSGTVFLPPPNCGYLSPTDVHMIIDGLPPGTTIQVAVQHERFFNVTHDPDPAIPGGEVEKFGSSLRLTLDGTGTLTGFHRNMIVQATCETHTGPHTPGNPVQSFDTEMFALQGQLPPGDPDFDLLRITAGTGFGMPSPGHTTLTLASGGHDWNVDSFFDITYRIDFVGHPGGPLGGHSGSTTGTIRMGTGQPAPPPPGPCQVLDNGTGTVDLPPQGCGYVSPADLHMMINGLPPGTTINVDIKHQDFFQVTHTPGGSLGGEIENFHSGLFLNMNGTNSLSGFHKTANIQTQCQTHVAPRTPGNNIQSFDTDMFGIQGQLPPGDPDFDLLRITAGTGFGMPSPGHTTLTKSPPGTPPRGTSTASSTSPTGSISSVTRVVRWAACRDRRPAPSAWRPGSPRWSTSEESDQHPDRGASLQPSEPVRSDHDARVPAAPDGSVRLTVYDAAGKLVRNLTNELVPAGPHAMLWDGRDDIGHRLGSGRVLHQALGRRQDHRDQEGDAGAVGSHDMAPVEARCLEGRGLAAASASSFGVGRSSGDAE